MKPFVLLALLGLAACNDLTEPTPPIAGTYAYEAMGRNPATQSRRGSITIFDDDRRTARFGGTAEYRTASGQTVNSHLIGAFIAHDRIWFRFLDEPGVIHEGEFLLGTARGEVYLETLAGDIDWSFTLTRVR